MAGIRGLPPQPISLAARRWPVKRLAVGENGRDRLKLAARRARQALCGTAQRPASSGNYNADPKFVDADAGDFRLEPDSPLEGVFDEDVPLLATPAWNEYDQLTTLCGT
jgi:hypothetical protein